MADRRITRTRKDKDGDITTLCNPEMLWSPRSKAEAIWDIENRVNTYYGQWTEKRTEIRLVNGPTGKYLRTDRDDTTRNNLDDLPDC